MVNKRQAGNVTAGTSRDVKNLGKFASLYLPLVWQQMMMTYLWTYVMKKKTTFTSYAVIGSLNIFSSKSGSGWLVYHLEFESAARNIVPQNTLSAFIQKGALAFEYNVITIAIQAFTILHLLHQRLIFCLLGLCTLTEFSWKKKIRVHFLQVKWYFCEWFFQVPLPFGTSEVLFPFHILWCAILKTGQHGTP